MGQVLLWIIIFISQLLCVPPGSSGSGTKHVTVNIWKDMNTQPTQNPLCALENLTYLKLNVCCRSATHAYYHTFSLMTLERGFQQNHFIVNITAAVGLVHLRLHWTDLGDQILCRRQQINTWANSFHLKCNCECFTWVQVLSIITTLMYGKFSYVFRRLLNCAVQFSSHHFS